MQPMPQGMPPQMPPQGMGAFQQAAQSPQGGMPPGAPPPMSPRPPMPPQGGPQGGGQPMDPRVILQMIETLPPQVQQMLAQQVLQNAAQQGRGGDTMIAHLTPGEKTVPPEVQTPKVLATLNKAYKEKGVQPQQFTAGASQSSKNPSTGLPEYNFMSAFLPAALGIAGAAAAPFTGGASLGLSDLALASIGGGLGSAIGGLATGQTPTQAALSGIGSAAGGYGMGSLMGSGAGAAMNAAGVAPGAASESASAAADMAGGFPGKTAADIASGASAHAPIMGSQMLGNAVGNFNPMAAAGSALGGYMGGQMGATPKPNPPNYPPGFNTPMDPVGSKGSAQQQLGMNNSNQPMPSFSGFNPATNYPAAYNFYPRG